MAKVSPSPPRSPGPGHLLRQRQRFRDRLGDGELAAGLPEAREVCLAYLCLEFPAQVLARGHHAAEAVVARVGNEGMLRAEQVGGRLRPVQRLGQEVIPEVRRRVAVADGAG